MTIIREHDLLHKIIHGANYFIFSLEDQNYLDPSMVLWSSEYTVGEYVKQRHEIQKMHDRKKELKGDEYLSYFSVEDLLKPVAVVAIFFGDGEWKGAHTLHELLDWTDIPEEWKGLFMDYRMHLIEVQKIENLEFFHSDLKLLFGFLQSKNNKKKLNFFLVSENRLDDLKRAVQDKEFQNMLLKTYAI